MYQSFAFARHKELEDSIDDDIPKFAQPNADDDVSRGNTAWIAPHVLPLRQVRVSARDQKLFDKLGSKFPNAYALYRSSSFFKLLATNHFHCDLGQLKTETLELVLLFLVELAPRFHSISIEDSFHPSNMRKKRGTVRRSTYPPHQHIQTRLAATLPKCLVAAANLQRLELVGLRLKKTAYTKLGQCVAGCKRLLGLYMQDCNLRDAGLLAWVTALGGLPLQQLQLCRCGLTSKSGSHIAFLISRSSSRRDLEKWQGSLRDTSFLDAFRNRNKKNAKGGGAKEAEDSDQDKKLLSEHDLLEKVATQSRGLVSIDLHHNKLGDAGTEDICEALKKDEYVAALDLRLNGLTSEGARHVNSLLKGNTTIVQFAISPTGRSTRTGRRPVQGLHNTPIGQSRRKDRVASARNKQDDATEERERFERNLRRVKRRLKEPQRRQQLDALKATTWHSLLPLQDLASHKKDSTVSRSKWAHQSKNKPKKTRRRKTKSQARAPAPASDYTQPATEAQTDSGQEDDARQQTDAAALNDLIATVAAELERHIAREVQLAEENASLRKEVERLRKLAEPADIKTDTGSDPDDHGTQAKVQADHMISYLESNFSRLHVYMEQLETLVAAQQQAEEEEEEEEEDHDDDDKKSR